MLGYWVTQSRHLPKLLPQLCLLLANASLTPPLQSCLRWLPAPLPNAASPSMPPLGTRANPSHTFHLSLGYPIPTLAENLLKLAENLPPLDAC